MMIKFALIFLIRHSKSRNNILLYSRCLLTTEVICLFFFFGLEIYFQYIHNILHVSLFNGALIVTLLHRFSLMRDSLVCKSTSMWLTVPVGQTTSYTTSGTRAEQPLSDCALHARINRTTGSSRSGAMISWPYNIQNPRIIDRGSCPRNHEFLRRSPRSNDWFTREHLRMQEAH
jgi:hypothetical protein